MLAPTVYLKYHPATHQDVCVCVYIYIGLFNRYSVCVWMAGGGKGMSGLRMEWRVGGEREEGRC